MGDFSGEKVAVTNLCKKDNAIPWWWCADVCQATKDWVGSINRVEGSPTFLPAGRFDESASSGGACVIGRMEGGLM